MTDAARAFRGFRFPAEVILWAVRWYLQFPISYRDLETMLADRGVAVDHTTMYRWVQRFAPELEKRMRRHLRPCRGPWYVDETYIRVNGGWRYLYRAVDGTGQTIDFLLSAKRDKKAAKRFFTRALGREAKTAECPGGVGHDGPLGGGGGGSTASTRVSCLAQRNRSPSTCSQSSSVSWMRAGNSDPWPRRGPT